MEYVQDFLNWAWQRHHNELSWNVRVLLTVPFCYFAYRRSVPGMIATVLAIATSMFWFAAPASVDASTSEFLAIERKYVEAPWTLPKVALVGLIPVWFGALAYAFWKRSWLTGLVILNAGAVVKVLWSFTVAKGAAWSIVPAVVLGLIVSNGVFLWAYRRARRAGPLPATTR